MPQTQTQTQKIPRIPEEVLGIAAQGYSLHVEDVGDMLYPPAERRWARDDFYFYAEASRDGEGKAAGSHVVLMRDGQLVAEFPGGAHEKLRCQKVGAEQPFEDAFFARAYSEWQQEILDTLLPAG